MHQHNLDPWWHRHRFAPDTRPGEQRTRLVIGLTLTTMLVEIAAGLRFGSRALLADGWHMATHVAALSITTVTY